MIQIYTTSAYVICEIQRNGNEKEQQTMNESKNAFKKLLCTVFHLHKLNAQFNINIVANILSHTHTATDSMTSSLRIICLVVNYIY